MTLEFDNQGFVEDNEKGRDEDSLKHKSNGQAEMHSVTSAKEKEAACGPEEEEDLLYGWFSFRPKILQFLNNSVGFLVVLSTFSFAQSMTVTGLVYVVITTIERRFNLTSLKSGIIASMYDIASMVVMLFVTYFGERSNKPVWIGSGAIIFGLGSLLFALPHFTTGLYNYGSTTEEICNINGTVLDPCGTEGDENLSKYFGVFIVAQCLHGIGATPLYTLGQAFIDENVKTKKIALYLGIFQVVASFSPALGFVFGGVFLSLYTDVRVDDSEINIDPSSPVWVGGWWIGFIFTGSVCLLVSVWVLGFPWRLPGYSEVAKARVNEAQKGSEFTVRAGFGNSLSDFPKAAWTLLKNPPFMFLNGGVTMEWFILASVAVFGPKFIESQFNLSAGSAAVLTGALVVPSTLIGCGAGAWFIMKFKLDFKGQMKLCFVSLLISFCAVFIFTASCPNVAFAGVTVPYTTNGTELDSVDISSPCNDVCHCEQKFDPVCGLNNVMYYSACHAGCRQQSEYDDSIYENCSCLHEGEQEAEIGRCEEPCDLLWIYFCCLFIMLTMGFFTIVPTITSTFRVVAFSQRAFAVGLQSLMLKLLGSIPGPIIFGALIDQSCLIWEYDCEAAGTCWMHDNRLFALYTFSLILSGRIVSLLCFAAAFFTHKPIVQDDEDALASEGTDDKNGSLSMKSVCIDESVEPADDVINKDTTDNGEEGENKVPTTEL